MDLRLPASAEAVAAAERGDLPQRLVSARVSIRTRLKEIWGARELFVFLVRKELKVRYKNSALGFLWSFLNPALVLAIYFVVFRYLVPNGIRDFAVYLFCGLLPWNIFNTTILSSAGTLVAHAGIVKKVAFPREVLPLAQAGTAAMYFLFQVCILVLFLVGFRVMPDWKYLPILLLALVCDLVLSAALAVLLAALNVYMRDIEHLVQVLLVALFFGPPIVYPYVTIATKLGHHGLLWAYLIDPLVPIVLAFQRCIFGNVAPPRAAAAVGHPAILPLESGLWYVMLLAAVLAFSVALFFFAMLVFRRVEGNFAEEL